MEQFRIVGLGRSNGTWWGGSSCAESRLLIVRPMWCLGFVLPDYAAFAPTLAANLLVTLGGEPCLWQKYLVDLEESWRVSERLAV
jgi:hypothetical protein